MNILFNYRLGFANCSLVSQHDGAVNYSLKWSQMCRMMYYNHLIFTLPETDMAPENGWLDDEMSFWDGLFSGETCLPTIHFQVLCYFQGKYLFLYSIYKSQEHFASRLHICQIIESWLQTTTDVVTAASWRWPNSRGPLDPWISVDHGGEPPKQHQSWRHHAGSVRWPWKGKTLKDWPWKNG